MALRPELLDTVARDHGTAGDVGPFQDRLGDLFGELRLLPDRLLGSVAPLADQLALIGDPCTLFLEHLVFDPEVEKRAGGRDALVVHDVELALGEGRGNLVLHHLYLGPVADDLSLRGLYLVLAADIDADRGEELECAAA